MKIKVTDLEPNPFRKMERYPIDRRYEYCDCGCGKKRPEQDMIYDAFTDRYYFDQQCKDKAEGINREEPEKNPSEE